MDTSNVIAPFKQWQVTANRGIDGLKLAESATIDKIGEEEVIVEMHAASLNFMDLFVAKGGHPGMIPFQADPGRVPGCDGAGVVKVVGSSVTSLKPGDKVVTHLFKQISDDAKIDFSVAPQALGMGTDGTLAQFVVLHATNLLPAPNHLDFEEAATLPCSGLTAYNALFGLGGRIVKKDDWVLVQGTGGVSVAALQIAVAAGAHVVATTSSAVKAARLKQLGVTEVINYRETPEWGTSARAVTPGNRGFDHIIDVGGNASLGESVQAVKVDGVISTIGLVGGPTEQQVPMLAASQNACIVRGLVAGTRQQMKDYIKFLERTGLRPALDDERFGIRDAKAAYWRQDRQEHFSKVVIQLQH